MRDLRDERGLALGWLGKTLLVFAIFGIIAFEFGSVVVNYFSLDSKADEIALTLSSEVQDGHIPPNNQIALEAAAKPLVKQAEARMVSVSIDPEGILHIEIKRSADTLLLGRIGATKDWTKAISAGQAGTN